MIDCLCGILSKPNGESLCKLKGRSYFDSLLTASVLYLFLFISNILNK